MILTSRDDMPREPNDVAAGLVPAESRPQRRGESTARSRKPVSTSGSCRQRLADKRNDGAAIKLDRSHEAIMRQRAGAVLHLKP